MSESDPSIGTVAAVKDVAHESFAMHAPIAWPSALSGHFRDSRLQTWPSFRMVGIWYVDV